MTTFTKEQLSEKAKENVDFFRERLELMPQSEAMALSLHLAEIALASLEAKPIGAFHISDQQVGGTTDYIKDGEWPIDDGVIEVYAAPPAPVLPEELLSAMEEVLRISDRDHEAWHQARAGIVACRAAMQGKAESQDGLAFDNQVLSGLYHAQEKRLFKIARRIKGPAFDKYAYSPSQAIDVLEAAIFGDSEVDHASMIAAAPQQEVKP